MTIYYLDSSALVKRYISEVGSTWVLELFDPALDNEIFVAAIREKKSTTKTRNFIKIFSLCPLCLCGFILSQYSLLHIIIPRSFGINRLSQTI